MNRGEIDSLRAVGQSSQRPFLYHDGNGDDGNGENGNNNKDQDQDQDDYFLCHDGNGNISIQPTETVLEIDFKNQGKWTTSVWATGIQYFWQLVGTGLTENACMVRA